MKNNNLTINKANALNSASYKLSLDENRLLLFCIASLDSKGRVPEFITIQTTDFAEMFDIDPKNAYKQLSEAVKTLYDRNVGMELGKDEQIKYRRWLDGRGGCSTKGEVSVSFAHWVKPYLGELKSHYTSLQMAQVSRLKSAHAIRMYEFISQFKSTGYRIVSVAEFRRIFDIQDSQYKVFKDLRVRVIKPALKEINKQMPAVKLDCREIKKGRAVDKLSFEFRLQH